MEAGLILEIPRRTSAMMWILRARILLELSAKSGDDCAQITEIQQWVSEAERSLDEANNTGVEVPNSGVIQRQFQRRRTTLQEKCANNVPD